MKRLLVLLCLLSVTLSAANEGFQLTQSDDCGKINEIPGEPRTKVPWVAGIFAQTSSTRPFQFLITGTILGPSTIITVLGGVYGEPPAKGRKYSVPSAANHRVVVGLKSTDLNDKDEHTQIVEVSYILPYKGNDPENKHYHFFLFQLKTPLNLKTPYARAACIPVFAKHLPSSPYGQELDVLVGGFAGANNVQSAKKKELKVVDVHLESKAFCDERFTSFYRSESSHVYCGKLTLAGGQQPICTSYGSASVVPIYNSRWFIIGINALHPMAPDQNSWCSGDTVFFFGRLIKAMDWILDNLECPGQQFACGNGKCLGLESVCNRRAECEDGRDEDPIYCRARKPCIVPGRTFECGTYGPCLKNEMVCDGRKDCPEGEDETQEACSAKPEDGGYLNVGGNQVAKEPPTSSPRRTTSTTAKYVEDRFGDNGVRCPPLQRSEGVTIECTDENNEVVPCEQAIPGTMAKLQCQRHYVSTYRLPNTVMTCKEDGNWKPFRAFGCEAQCGIIEGKLVQSYIVGGQVTTEKDAFPWHAAMFIERRANEYAYICGGSLIEKNVIITAAHCLTDGAGHLFQQSTLKVVLGGNSSNLEVSMRSPHAQVFNVKNSWVPATYDRRTLQSDIGLILLDREAKYGDYVRPACYLVKGSNSVPQPGTFGKIPGYGYTSENKISQYSQFVSYPVISPQECIASLRKTPPLSTFCAGYKNGTSVCQGDSGGGMVFPEKNSGQEKYVLRGLVSHGDVKEGRLCDPNNYAVFTHVDAYADWILQKLESILK